jgi:hypothetical protein
MKAGRLLIRARIKDAGEAFAIWVAAARCLENYVRHARVVAELLDQPGLADPSAAGDGTSVTQSTRSKV